MERENHYRALAANLIDLITYGIISLLLKGILRVSTFDFRRLICVDLGGENGLLLLKWKLLPKSCYIYHL
jgi:hypothetical protein